jgi:peptidoglycan hydrolase CwlO-like protein
VCAWGFHGAQADVIAHLMTRGEEWCSAAAEAEARAAALADDNSTLEAAVTAQAAALERLIALNAELTDQANAAAAARDAAMRAAAPAAPAGAAVQRSVQGQQQAQQQPRRSIFSRAFAYVTGTRDAVEQRTAMGRTQMPV